MTPAERRAAIYEAAGEKRSAALRVRATGPSCLFCVHGPAESAQGICGHPLFWNFTADPVKGDVGGKSMTATDTARSSDGLCGPEAELFEPRNVVDRVMRALGLFHPIFKFWLILIAFMVISSIIITVQGRW